MPPSRLTALQHRVLESLAGAAGGWTLTGGGALAGFHTGHRPTRDLDLFWHGRSELGDAREEIVDRLRNDGFQVEIAQSAPAFVRLLVRSQDEVLVVDLVAEPVPNIEPPEVIVRWGRELRVDTAQEILVNKLCALLQRSELRDLLDVQALLERGTDLERAIRDAPRKDGAFSPLTLVWAVRGLPIEAMARASGMAIDEAQRAVAFRDELVLRMARLADPGDSAAPG